MYEEWRLKQKWVFNNSFLRCLYVVGDENLEEESLIKDNILYVKCEDDICHLPKKFICALAAFENYKYVFVTEDDYFYVNPHYLENAMLQWRNIKEIMGNNIRRKNSKGI